jgi:hypothetical protein
MFVPLPVLAAAVALILLLVMLVAHRRRERPDLLQPPKPLALPGELEARVRELLVHGDTIDAIKLVRKSTGAGLKESKDYVDGLAGGT